MNRWTHTVGATVVAVVLGTGLVAMAPAASPAVGAGSLSADPVGSTPSGGVTSIQMTPPALSVPVRDLLPGGDGGSAAGAAPQRVNPLADTADQGAGGTRNRANVPSDPLIVGRPSTRAAVRTPATNLVFDGTGNPLGCGTCSPPDTTGDVGPNHYIQLVNATKVAIYNKSGVLLKPAFDLSTLFSSLGGACYANDRGDPQVLYDPLADRWLLSQFTPKGANTLCFAISQTSDPLGAYYLYSFATPDFPDYFKVGVWPTGYYVGDNESTYAAYALDRTKMLAGLPATAVRVGDQTNLLMPADVDGTTAPSSAGGLFYTFKSKNYAPHSVPTDRLEVFQMTPDFSAGTAAFSTIATLPVTPFTFTVCGFMVFVCVPQKDTAQKVDSVSEWPMQRFAYRKLADRETLVGNFTVGGGTAAPGAAIRWFELGNTGSGWTLRQEGTQDLGDGLNRWMGSIAMDADGNIALAGEPRFNSAAGVVVETMVALVLARA
ncbi:MAG: hypothetical protein WCP28_16990, partial [Actinomycetes bacterium]